MCSVLSGTRQSKDVVILAYQRSRVIWLENFPALTDACERLPAIGKENFRSLHILVYL